MEFQVILVAAVKGKKMQNNLPVLAEWGCFEITEAGISIALPLDELAFLVDIGREVE
jgi:hypothetical protein